MMNQKMDYWKECISEAFDDAGITATEEQINTVASWVQGAHENYGMAFGHDCIQNQLESEVSRLQLALKNERSKSTCQDCGGSGRIIIPGPYHSGESACQRCRGEGRH